MRLGQLAILPTPDGRTAERRVVNLAASLREPGAQVASVDVLNLSVTGFAAETDLALETGAYVWLKIPGLEATNSRVVWVDGGKAGFEFVNALHPATLETVLAASKKPAPRRGIGIPLFSTGARY